MPQLKRWLRPPNGMITTSELARELQVTVSTIYNWINKGQIADPVNRFSGMKVWTREEVNAIRERLVERDAVEVGS